MEKYNELNITSNKILLEIQELKKENNKKLKILLKKIKKEKLQYDSKIYRIKENNFYINFNDVLGNYFKLVYNFTPVNKNRINIINDNLNLLGKSVIEKLFDLSSVDILIKKYVAEINNVINNLDNNLNYFFFKIYNLNDNILNHIDFSDIQDYFAYLFLNDKELPRTLNEEYKNPFIKNIQDIYKLKINPQIDDFLKKINNIITFINELELTNYLSTIKNFSLNYKKFVDEYKKLEVLINKDIFKINDYQFLF